MGDIDYRFVDSETRMEAFNKIKDWNTLIEAFRQMGSYESIHSLNVRNKTAFILAQMEKCQPDLIPEGTDILNLILAAWFHDIGKLMIPAEILDSPNKLTYEEFEEMKKHADYSKLALSNVKDFANKNDIILAAAMHHEALDGSGYPYGLKEADIPFGAKLIRIIDCYDAMTMNRQYHNALDEAKALSILSKDSQNGKIDKNLFDFFYTCSALVNRIPTNILKTNGILVSPAVAGDLFSKFRSIDISNVTRTTAPTIGAEYLERNLAKPQKEERTLIQRGKLYDNLRDAIKNKYPSANISIVDVPSTNGGYKGLSVSFERGILNPVFNLDKIEKGIQSQSDFNRIVAAICEEIKDNVVYSIIDLDILKDPVKLKDHVCLDIVPMRGNEEFLKSVPYQPFQRDMAIIAKAVITNSFEESRYPIVIINNKLMEAIDIDKDLLFKEALRNSTQINQPEIMSISDYLFGEEYVEKPNLQTHNENVPVLIMVTKTGICPSSCMLDHNMLQQAAERLKGNFYLIPTNRGAMAIPEWAPEIREMVKSLEGVLKEGDKMNGMTQIGELQYYDSASKTLEHSIIIDEKLKRIEKEDLKSNIEKQNDKNKDNGVNR